MKENPSYEDYPVGDEEMGIRYSNWTESLTVQMAAVYEVGKEVEGRSLLIS